MIDGGKRFITNAGQAGTYIVTARTGTTDDGDAEISAFIVPADTPGFSVGRLEDKMGLHASATGELVFDGVPDPGREPARRAGRPASGRSSRSSTAGGSRIGALAVGLAQAAPRRGGPVRPDARAVRAADRHLPGRRVPRSPTWRPRSRPPGPLVWRAAWLKDQGRDYALAAAQAKLFASEVSSRVTNAAIQVHGGYGYVEEYKVERFLRDAKLTEIGEGTSQIQRLVIARRILGLRVG